METRSRKGLSDGVAVATGLLFILAVLLAVGLFAWWAFSWSTHTLVWFIFIFGSILGSVKVRTK